MDIAAKKGADIVAPFSGTVTRAETARKRSTGYMGNMWRSRWTATPACACA
ncbi:MAG: hypothetical protein ACLRRT_12480 [Ruthenibacterium lactatiformans]